jgi:ATP-dependent Lon protease
MFNKNSNNNNNNNKNNTNNENKMGDFEHLINKKIEFFKDIIQKTLLYVQKNKTFDILGISDVVMCLDKLTDLNNKMNEMNQMNKVNSETIISSLQIVNNELSSLMKNYGTESLNDLLFICFGNTKLMNQNNVLKFELLQKYFHPTGYKVINKKEKHKNKNKITEDTEIDEKTNNLDCFDVLTMFKQFHLKVYGIKLYICNEDLDKSLIIYGILDEAIVDFINNPYVLDKKKQFLENIPKTHEFEEKTFHNFMESLMLKDYLLYDSNTIYNKFIGYLSQLNNIKQKTISQTIKDFITDDIYLKRLTLIQLLITCDNNYENQYLAYLLYDLLTNDTNNNIDTQEQTILFDSFPWFIKRKFLHSMKNTVQYTNELSNIEMNKIPLEQQICIMKATDHVKEKAMAKLKEIKNKSEDTGSKARHYLEGLLKIPFGIYRKEPILTFMEKIKRQFTEICSNDFLLKMFPEIPRKEKYTSIEIINYIEIINKKNKQNGKNDSLHLFKKNITHCDKDVIISNIIKINELLPTNKIVYINKKKIQLKSEIEDWLEKINNEESNENKEIIVKLKELFISKTIVDNNKVKIDNTVNVNIDSIYNSFQKISNYISMVKNILDKAVHGHDKAKKQIERIVGQWINGEQDGYCFGFEGPPGVGKTSLAKKGLSACLKDDKGNPRPFAMIQMGGDSNGSTLHGHNYTYVGSTWGSIVQILMDKKCMNPIIFIDEIDKISKTEHGREIVGILTHLLDPAQNDCFQDKYFTGIDLDLSKALFILSYNDAEAIDKILLDRIHRIQFNTLSLEDKLVICKNHILPEIYKKMGLEEMIELPESTLTFIIDNYTQEAGVRKLKELLFEIVAEINLDILKHRNERGFPIVISKKEIEENFLNDKRVIQKQKIHDKSVNNVINGMYANSLGQGGILPFQCCFTPAQSFLEIILTGNQQEVMKEGMIISRNLAWSLTPESVQNKIIKKYNDAKKNCIYGININALGLSIPKDGPSASSTITVLIYALLNNKKIKNYFAMTGEVSLDGNITEIGGLEHKILGSLKSLVTSFIFPKENEKDFKDFMKKYKNDELIKNAHFYPVSTLQEVFDLIFE